LRGGGHSPPPSHPLMTTASRSASTPCSQSVVLHKIEATSVKSTFPLALGVNITGVDAATFGITGEAFSAVVLPDQSSTSTQLLQKDPVRTVQFEQAKILTPASRDMHSCCSQVDLAYEFARKFPGYTGESDRVPDSNHYQHTSSHARQLTPAHPSVHRPHRERGEDAALEHPLPPHLIGPRLTASLLCVFRSMRSRPASLSWLQR
jgi:hypothetical protein